MGIVIDSCKQHMVCCNTEDKELMTEPNIISRNLYFTENEEEINQTEGDEIYKRIESSNDLMNLKVKINDLILEHQTSPWNHYKEIVVLGSGTYGTVKKVCLIKNPSTIRAMKIISKEYIIKGVNHSKLIDEIKILKKLDHPNIMKIYEFFFDDKNFYIISDFCDQGDLLGKLEKLGTMNEIVVKFLMEQIFNAVAYLHSKKVLHGDIKLENILLYTATSKNKGRRFTSINLDINEMIDLRKELNRSKSVTKRSKNYINDMLNYEIKLIDFGCSKYFVNKNRHRQLRGIIGSTLYCSPEVVDDLYDELSDEWSCGVLMYILLSGEPPFQGETEDEIFKQIKKCNYSFKSGAFKEVSYNCKNLIKRLLEPNKKKRIKASEALRHPFFTEFFNPSKAMTENKDLSILKKLINHKKSTSKFHEATYAFICNNFISIDEEKKLREVFRYIDKDGKNALSKLNLKECLKEININLSDEELELVFKILDANQSNAIEYQEFLRATCDKNSLLTEENLKNTFLVLSQGKGKEFINGNDIKKFIFHDLNIEDNILNEYLEQFGMKNGEKMDFKQFCEILKNDTKLNLETIEGKKDSEESSNEDEDN
jgi:calcium-dependent protein kinase